MKVGDLIELSQSRNVYISDTHELHKCSYGIIVGIVQEHDGGDTYQVRFFYKDGGLHQENVSCFSRYYLNKLFKKKLNKKMRSNV